MVSVAAGSKDTTRISTYSEHTQHCLIRATSSDLNLRFGHEDSESMNI